MPTATKSALPALVLLAAPWRGLLALAACAAVAVGTAMEIMLVDWIMEKRRKRRG